MSKDLCISTPKKENCRLRTQYMYKYEAACLLQSAREQLRVVGLGGLLYSNPTLQVSKRLPHSSIEATSPRLVLSKPRLKRHDPVSADILVVTLPEEDDTRLVDRQRSQLAALLLVWDSHLLKQWH